MSNEFEKGKLFSYNKSITYTKKAVVSKHFLKKETGTYTHVIEQNTPVDPLNFAMEIGVILDKANK